jgi:glutathione S-transferase
MKTAGRKQKHILRWAINTQVGLQGFENLSRFVDRMNLDAGVRTALATEAESR